MKNTLAIATLFIIALSSCKSSKESVAQRKAEIQQSREDNTSCFVELNDGTINHYTTLKLVTGMLKTPYLLADGQKKIRGNEIKAYQNKDHYAMSQVNFSSGRISYVAKETLPGFAVRIAKGRINVYSKKFYNGMAAIDEYFVQLGNEGMVLSYTSENMNKLIAQDSEALDFFMTKKYTTPKSRLETVPVTFANNKKMGLKNK